MVLPASRTRAEEVVVYVEDSIDKGGLRPGDHIGTRADLREQTGVARATVNEAIRLLQERRRIVLRPGPGGGLFVAATDPVVRLGRTLLTVHGEPLAVAGAIEVREQLEPLVAAHAAQHRTAKDGRELKSLIAAMKKNQNDVPRFVSLNWDLHVRIAAISPNAVLRGTYVGLYEFVNQVSLVTPQPSDNDNMAQRLQVHSDLVAAIIAGDVAAAMLAAEAHRHSS
ncbi:FadR family transcriptional regulator [Streptomyces sp. So13.3]|uniref:FadR/GntR family transcriptional regulator n=1 Tax=Streptomyces TaxID=1883 RepID=UPI0011063754|nr:MULTISPECIES: FCD domain-containing protein [unclassified Streptomyces]MCZ4098702.1 FCD domain-containing protein [Streptomyces sp. H39-C1]QNA76265.1 FadR family transcriptional regulator [Streptomyces sp. So13.3]